MSMEKSENNVTILIEQSSLIELIHQNLFSDDTERFFDSCEFSSKRMAFMQGMNYAALLCGSNKIEKYPVHIKENKMKQGKWIPVSQTDITKDWVCSNCQGVITVAYFCKECYYNYCPHCGAKMREGTNEV